MVCWRPAIDRDDSRATQGIAACRGSTANQPDHEKTDGSRRKPAEPETLRRLLQ
jgi:hypothetical protein